MTEKEICDYLRFASTGAVSKSINNLKKAGMIRNVFIDGREYFTNTDISKDCDLCDRILILSPFDNLLINRKRLKFFFGADYRLECYLPNSKRKLGYFALPMLYRDDIIGYIDLKADRKNDELIVKNKIMLRKLSRNEESKLDESIRAFAIFNNCTNIRTKI